MKVRIFEISRKFSLAPWEPTWGRRFFRENHAHANDKLVIERQLPDWGRQLLHATNVTQILSKSAVFFNRNRCLKLFKAIFESYQLCFCSVRSRPRCGAVSRPVRAPCPRRLASRPRQGSDRTGPIGPIEGSVFNRF